MILYGHSPLMVIAGFCNNATTCRFILSVENNRTLQTWPENVIHE